MSPRKPVKVTEIEAPPLSAMSIIPLIVLIVLVVIGIVYTSRLNITPDPKQISPDVAKEIFIKLQRLETRLNRLETTKRAKQ